jgi:GLPGLI family protein
VAITGVVQGQITSGRIVFERKTNLKKKYANNKRMLDWLSEGSQSKIDKFELLFNDTASVFRPVESDLTEKMGWTTTKNSVYQNVNKNEKLTILAMYGQNIFVKDSISKRVWKVTESKRYIDKYHCRKAVYEKNDSTRIYAWFAVELETPVGPEGFGGLPGAILGLATEDGGIIYFAKEIELIEPKEELLRCKIGKNKVYSMDELEKEIEEKFSNSRWGKGMFTEMFRWL